MKLTRSGFERHLNDMGVPEDQRRSNGGPVGDATVNYGSWLRKNDVTAFNVMLNEWIRKNNGGALCAKR